MLIQMEMVLPDNVFVMKDYRQLRVLVEMYVLMLMLLPQLPLLMMKKPRLVHKMGNSLIPMVMIKLVFSSVQQLSIFSIENVL